MTQTIIDLDRTYTNAEFEALPTEGRRLELIEGKLVEKMPGDTHGRIGRRIILKLGFFDRKARLGVMWPGTTFDLGEGWQPIPDLGFLVASRVPPETEGAIRVIPDLVVEVHSPSDLDSKPGRDAAARKIRHYQEAGVRLIWAINPRAKTVEVYHYDQAEPIATLSLKDTLEGEDVIPGFKLKVRTLFED